MQDGTLNIIVSKLNFTNSMHFNPPYLSVGEFCARTIDMNLLPKSEAKSKITSRIENLSVHTLRKVSTHSRFLRLRAYVFAYAVKPLTLNESDRVRVHFRKDRYLDMLTTALEVRLAQILRLCAICAVSDNSGAVYSNRIWLCFAVSAILFAIYFAFAKKGLARL